jgi:hypothetical protein
MRALVKRAGEGDESALRDMAQLSRDADQALHDAVVAFRSWQPPYGAPPPSWRDVGELLGVTRQTAHERFSQ